MASRPTGAKAAAKSKARDTTADIWVSAGHDLQQPMQSLALTVRVLGLDCTDAERQSALRHLGLIVDSLDDMLSTLIELARLANGSRSAGSSRVMLDDLVNGVVDECRPAATAAGITLEPTTLAVEIKTDPRLLTMAIRGLLLFAIKFGTGDRIPVAVLRRRGKVVVDVGYEGAAPGNALDKQAFIELTPLDVEPLRPMQGLGLAMVVQVADLLAIGFEHGRGRNGTHRLSLRM